MRTSVGFGFSPTVKLPKPTPCLLRTNAQLARDYERTKMALGARYCSDRAAYTRAKAEFIRHVLSFT